MHSHASKSPDPVSADRPLQGRFKAFLLDMDGVLFHGERALPGAVDFMRAVADDPHVFITNNPIRSPGEVVARLVRLGFDRPRADSILTSADATALWLARQVPGFRYFAVGAAGLHRALEAVGRADSVAADFVVVGEGQGLDYQTLTTGINLILAGGARLVATNPDTTVDDWQGGRHRVLPGGGALVAPFAAATGCDPVIIGKPQPLLFRMALERLGAAPAECLMIGDRPDTDIAGAAAIGIRTALVRTGRFRPGDPWPEAIPRPDWDVDELTVLAHSLGLHRRGP